MKMYSMFCCCCWIPIIETCVCVCGSYNLNLPSQIFNLSTFKNLCYINVRKIIETGIQPSNHLIQSIKTDDDADDNVFSFHLNVYKVIFVWTNKFSIWEKYYSNEWLNHHHHLPPTNLKWITRIIFSILDRKIVVCCL